MKSRVEYPKGGRKPKQTRGVKEHSERLGDPYRFRHTMLGAGEEERYRNRMNDYGKSPQTDEPQQTGQMVSPLRTIISV